MTPPVHTNTQKKAKPAAQAAAPIEELEAPVPTTPVPVVRKPAVPTVPGNQSSLWGTGTVSLLTDPVPSTWTMAPEDASDLQDALFPKPLWRREMEEKSAGEPPLPKLPRGI